MKTAIGSQPKSKCPYCSQGEMGRLGGSVRCSNCSKVLDYAETEENPAVKGLTQNESDRQSLLKELFG